MAGISGQEQVGENGRYNLEKIIQRWQTWDTRSMKQKLTNQNNTMTKWKTMSNTVLGCRLYTLCNPLALQGARD